MNAIIPIAAVDRHVTRATCPYCGTGCGVLIETREGRITDVQGDPEHPANFGRLCTKGSTLHLTAAPHVQLQARLLTPQRRQQRGEPPRACSWDDALDEAADRLADIVRRHGPDAVGFYGSGQLLTEDYYVLNKLVKGLLGTNNLDTNSRLCMSSAVAGYKVTLGADAPPACYDDFQHAHTLFIVGANTAYAHPILFRRIEDARRANPTLKLIVADPRRTETADMADLFLQILPGTDVALFHGLLHVMLNEGMTDPAYIERHTQGFEALKALVSDFTPGHTAAMCGIAEADLVQAARWMGAHTPTLSLYCQGLNQSSRGTDKNAALINLHLATGQIGRSGAGPFSLTGQPNAMGGREVGALSNTLAAHMDFGPAEIDRIARFWQAPRLATKPGLKAVDLFEAVRAGRIKAVWIMATNPVDSLPDADAVREALRGCEYAIVSEAIRATDTVEACRIRLPALAWAEKDGTVTNSERGISRQRPFLPPPGEAKQDWWIVSEVARRLGHGEAFAWHCVADIFREHAALSAFENGGRRDFDIGACATLDDAAYESLQPFVWGGGPDQRFFGDGGFFHADHRARFVATTVRAPVNAPDPSRPLILNTGRVRDQWHTMTRTGKSVRLAGHRPEPAIELHPRDASARGLADGDIAEVTSARGRCALRVHVTDSVRFGEAFAPMHWTAQVSRAGRINAAVNPAVDPISGQPELKHTPVEIRRLGMRWHGTILARRAVMLPEISYWARIRGAGYHAYLVAGDQPFAVAQQALSAAVRTANPGPWLVGESGVGAVISDGRVEAVLSLGPTHQAEARDRFAPFMALDRLTTGQRDELLHGGSDTHRGGELCACFGVSCGAVEAAIADGATSLAAIGAATQAGTNCGSCRPEIRALLRAARLAKAA